MKNTDKRIRVVFADDHEVVRTGLRTLFEETEECLLVGEAGDGEQAIQLIARKKPDVAILDISMPKINGLEVARIVKEKHPEVRVLILTMYEDEGYVKEMVRAGADGYVVKNADKKEIITAVRMVASGERFFSPTISKLMIEGFIKKASTGDTKSDSDIRLTKREIEILSFVAEGLTSREIADKLFLSLNTINTHRTNIMKKLNIHDTAGLVKYALQNGLASMTPIKNT
jgi:DNA-binding NarL/FixJ family response regulator